MTPLMQWSIAALGLAALLAASVTLNALRGRLGWTAVAETPEALAAQLEPGFTWTVPAGDGPFPAAILLSGCDGPKPNLTRLAAALAEAGWLSVIVDSHTPRGLDRRQAWRLVCAAQILNGAERASDIAVALAALRARRDVAADRIALVGLSHGGWTALDYLALAARGDPPPLLTDWPEALAAAPLAGVKAAILFYPYCGIASMGGADALPTDLRYLFHLVEDDTIVDETACAALAADLAAAGADVEVDMISGVTHGFDQREKSALSTLEFSPEATAQALARTLALLRAL